jgi:hypothetical protein
VWPFIKRLISSRVGHLLFVVHLCLVVHCFAQSHVYENVGALSWFRPENVFPMGFIAGRFLDFDSTLLAALLRLNLLPLLADKLVMDIMVFLFPHVEVITFSWAQAYLLIGLTSAQWLSVGYFIERMIKLYRAAE